MWFRHQFRGWLWRRTRCGSGHEQPQSHQHKPKRSGDVRKKLFHGLVPFLPVYFMSVIHCMAGVFCRQLPWSVFSKKIPLPRVRHGNFFPAFRAFLFRMPAWLVLTTNPIFVRKRRVKNGSRRRCRTTTEFTKQPVRILVQERSSAAKDPTKKPAKSISLRYGDSQGRA